MLISRELDIFAISIQHLIVFRNGGFFKEDE